MCVTARRLWEIETCRRDWRRLQKWKREEDAKVSWPAFSPAHAVLVRVTSSMS